MKDNGAWQAEGAISFTSFATRLLRTDVSVLDDPGFAMDDDAVRLSFWFNAAKGAALRTDFVSHQSLPPAMGHETRSRLFHERLHYCQLMSYPLLQLHSLLGLESLRTAMLDHGGAAFMLAGLIGSGERRNPSELGGARTVTEALVSGTTVPTSTKVSMPDGVTDAGLVDARLVREGAPPCPGLAGVLRLEEDDVLVAFNAENLLESAAYVSQFLFERQEPPRLRDSDAQRELRYLGCWEVWCRFHEARYPSTRDLALGFLAAIDLALGAHVHAQLDHRMQDHLRHPATSAQIRYPHARFGLVLLAAALVKPVVENVDPALSIAAISRFQHEICENLGWGDPQRGFAFMGAFLTQRFIVTTLWSFEDKVEIDDDLVAHAVNTPLADLADDLTALQPIWSKLAEAFHAVVPEVAGTVSVNCVFGSRVLAKMIAASYFRGTRPPVTAAPHLDPARLHERFALPLIRIGGQYYADIQLNDDFDPTVHGLELKVLHEDPFRLSSVDVLTDCVTLAALDGVRRNGGTCGLIDPVTREPGCLYAAAGAGCPQLGLAADEADLRQRKGIADWCHWTFVAGATGLQHLTLDPRRPATAR